MAYANEMANMNVLRFESLESDIENYRIGEFYTTHDCAEDCSLLRDLETSVNEHEVYPYYISLRYVNTEGLGFRDFICSVEDKILRVLSKNRAFVKRVHLRFVLDGRFDESHFDGDNKFAVNGLPINDIVGHAVKRENDSHNFFLRFECNCHPHPCYMRWGRHDYPYETKYTIDDIGVRRLHVEIYIDKFRLLHKRKSCIDSDVVYEANRRAHKRIFKDEIQDELMIVTWHPDRFLDWCVDIEELKFLKELWGVEC